MATFGDFPPEHKQDPQNTSLQNDQWERKILQDLAFAAIKEQRATRRWGYLFKFLVLLYFVAIFLMTRPFGESDLPSGPHTALVDVSGVIAPDMEASADRVVTGIREAFESPQAKALILRMNTPGGSPVQSGVINDEITRLRATRPDFPVYAVIQDVCASGGYYIAVAANEIYADKASIVGSIGVRMDSFGFTEAMDKLGVERRSLTAGDNKAFLDPFMPMKEKDVEHAHEMLNNIHQQFIDVVKTGRGDRLKDNAEIFSGLFWSGEQALALGLIDGLANSSTVAREVVGAEEIVDYTPRPSYLDRFAGSLGVKISETLLNSQYWNVR
ncbi:S49 family peptidase [Methylophaga nitratireducenticrescens]|uniref:Periplasmic serine proteases (ClpP class) n=1 Tax=Methylophaga nitratireducenticrescens TaxID=754476 RepID=I1XMY8_METNJ|nr:S49 family peptidase [Methylophaga nitratireducenticrescens]AFI85757.1 S49 family peptidase [Methylophaga nitratireducenticrescens]AUZ85483.1 S49 family peptidase [Methylophaga nitratireducenticrescens]